MSYLSSSAVACPEATKLGVDSLWSSQVPLCPALHKIASQTKPLFVPCPHSGAILEVCDHNAVLTLPFQKRGGLHESNVCCF